MEGYLLLILIGPKEYWFDVVVWTLPLHKY